MERKRMQVSEWGEERASREGFREGREIEK